MLFAEDFDVIKKTLTLEYIKNKKEIIHDLLTYSKSLPVIKYVFNFILINWPCFFFERSGSGQTILSTLVVVTYNGKHLEIIKYVLSFCKKNFETIFFQKDKIFTWGEYSHKIIEKTFLHNLCYSPMNTVKYVLNFCAKNYNSLFLEDVRKRRICIPSITSFSDDTAKYTLKFFIIRRPFMFLYKNNSLSSQNTFNSIVSYYTKRNETSRGKNIIKFCTLNFPEISIKTNNFILPLMLEIQN